ncbi:hypothetical protein FOA52_006680 [Chlamydomonas sp. UWO 241]|nr:hypothetical protein FOA52_006680 [Chlamydomonas sp. UWO 241]
MVGRDMSGCGRYAPCPRYTPLQFYSSVRLGDPEMLAKIMAADPYFATQDNGAGAPVHFATTYCQLDMLHHLLNSGAEVNQRDAKGFTPLHRAAYLAHLDGYLELYEYLLSRGADPSIASEDYDPYLDPGCKLPADVAVEEGGTREALRALEEKYAGVEKAPQPHPDVGDWWALYDYGLGAIKAWGHDYKPEYPEEAKRRRDREARAAEREERRTWRDTFLAAYRAEGLQAATATLPLAVSRPSPSTTGATAAALPAAPAGPGVFLFPGQGSQAVGMLKASADLPAVKKMLDTAATVLGYDLLDVCVNGPKEALDATERAQPALFVAGLAAVELLRSRSDSDSRAVDAVAAAAGLSLGEYAALVFAGVLSFEDGLKVVAVRSTSMAAAAAVHGPLGPHGMCSIVGLPDEKLGPLVERVCAAQPAGTVLVVTNRLFPMGRVVSGHVAALTVLAAAATAEGALKTSQLAVAGAFHTSLMQPASEALAEVLRSVALHPPRIPVLSNVTAAPFPSDPDAMRTLLARQLLEPVMWEETLSSLLGPNSPAVAAPGAAAPAVQLYEMGPGQQIKAMVRRIDSDAWKVMANVQP